MTAAAPCHHESDLRSLLEALRGLRDGDFRPRFAPPPDSGVLAEIGEVLGQVLGRSRHVNDELARVSRQLTREGRLDERLAPSPGQGGWSAGIESANALLDLITTPLTNSTRVLEAVADGDLAQRADLEVRGRPLHGDLRRAGVAANRMVDQLALFTTEVTGVARVLGTEGRLGGGSKVRGMSGSWARVIESVNDMADRLTGQVRDIAVVTTAVARGDLTRKVTIEATGEMLELKLTVNTMVDQLSAFADEVTRVAREVGTEGRLGGQAQVRGVSGTWKDLTESVNVMASNLTYQVRNIAQVATAVAKGDLSQKIAVDVKGEMAELKNTLNTMVDQLSAFASEVTRVAREVGTEGNLGGRAEVTGASGVWKDLTDNVNYMANNLTSQVRNIAQITKAVADGDLSKKITVDAQGEILELKDTLNTMVDQLSGFAGEVTRVAREVGTEGRLGGQAQVRGASGVWKDLTDNVNFMADNLTTQVRNIAQVSASVANGDLTKKITVDARGEIFQLKETINTMVDRLSAFADEVTRVAREVGTEGELGGQARVRGVSGVWKDLTDNVNSMADNLTAQVRNIAQVTTAVAQGDLSKKIDVDARGEILKLKTTINTMVDTLSAFSSEVTRVAREVGSRGELGGQAQVPGASGVWRDLTDNVNLLAGNLTTQVRAIAEVAGAVARGDMTRAISVDARGEVAELKDNINLMVANLRETTRAKDWLESNLARFAGMMQGHRDLVEVASLILSELTPLVSAHYGAFFLAQREMQGDVPPDDPRAAAHDPPMLRFIAGYGYRAQGGGAEEIAFGEGLVGQAAVERKRILITEAPPAYIKISSGLGEASPACIVVLPIVFEERVLGVIELGAFSRFSDVHLAFFDQFVHSIGVAINTIIANARTESLLGESQRLTQQLQDRSRELQRQQAELRRSNAELEDKAALLATQNREIELQNAEIEQARRALEERAEQLSLASRYKSSFLANMSHELRTPLNSLLLLAKLMWANPDGNLTDEQVQYSRTIYGAGRDLLELIDDILDLSKIEAGKMEIHAGEIPLTKLVEYVNVTFRHIAVEQGLDFEVTVAEGAPDVVLTDELRLQQILRNLLSNAIKFTAAGAVRLVVGRADGVVFGNPALRAAGAALAFRVTDTGVGIPPDKLQAIFEAFQQADGTTSRKYGGTGLGLSICREIAERLGGEIQAHSVPGEGSAFTLYLPGTPWTRRPHRTQVGGDQTAVGPDGRTAEGLSADGLPAEGAEGLSADAPAGLPPIEGDAIDPGAVVARDELFDGRTVLIIDDDIRNVFALSTVLERSGLKVLYAADGRKGIEVLEDDEDVALVLMDVMMPGMDGYATTRAIRAMPRFADLPIVALTAQAMKGDQDKSVAAGMSDHVTKPVEIEHLFEVMRSWLGRDRGGARRA